jgi:anti-sigma factor RsiW
MTCRGTRNRLSAYLDGGLDPATTRQVGAHLEACGV